MGNHAGLTEYDDINRPAGGSLPSAGQRSWRRVTAFRSPLRGGSTRSALPLRLAASAGTIAYTKAQIGPPPLLEAQDLSITVVDRNDRLLRAFTTPRRALAAAGRGSTTSIRAISRCCWRSRTGRFYQHGGVDLRRSHAPDCRSASNGRIVSGASTLTMQVARLLDQRHERTASGKLRQIVARAAARSAASQETDPRLYLRLAPFGGNIEGVRAASLAYFGKEPQRLSVGAGRACWSRCRSRPSSAGPIVIPRAKRGARPCARYLPCGRA